MFETGARSVIEKILPVVDNFERGLAAIPEDIKDALDHPEKLSAVKEMMEKHEYVFHVGEHHEYKNWMIREADKVQRR